MKGLTNRFEEYPKLRELILRKDELIQNTNTPPMYLKCDLDTFDLRDLDSKFDVILLEPPLEEYQRTIGVTYDKYWSWEEIEKLEVEQVAAPRSFIWIWCGSSDGLDAGRRCLKKWGFRRCEDICWIKTNIKNPGHNKNLEPKAIFQRTKEHCLMGIRGTVRRSTDGDFIHANVDIDLVIAEEESYGSDEKPVEIFHIIEHFCLGRRRLHIFGKDATIRPGWLTIGPSMTSSNFDSEVYNGYYKEPNGYLTGCSEEIEHLRPKSPPPKVMGNMTTGSTMPRGGGAQRGGTAQREASAMRGIAPPRLAPPPRSALVPRGGIGWPRLAGGFQRVRNWLPRPMMPPR